MKHRRRYGGEEINLTPLLDVLFVVLFTVMLAGYSYQTQNSDTVENMEKQIAEMKEEVAHYKSQSDAYEVYSKSAIIVSADNIKRGLQHILIFNVDNDTKEIVLGNDNLVTFSKQIESYVNDLIKIGDNQPVYIVFNCDEDSIYKVEYDTIYKCMKELESNNKEVFFKISTK